MSPVSLKRLDLPVNQKKKKKKKKTTNYMRNGRILNICMKNTSKYRSIHIWKYRKNKINQKVNLQNNKTTCIHKIKV